MQLHSLKPKTAKVTNPPVGRGGKRGKTSGRGGKGQTARAGHKIRPEARDLIKKFPKRRGYGKNRARGVRRERDHYMPVNLAVLEALFKTGETVTPGILLTKGVVRAQKGRPPLVKILGTGELTKALVLKKVSVSTGARAAIVKAGGTINA